MTQEKNTPVKVLFRIKGIKATPQRIAVFETMRMLGHASADAVYEAVKSDHKSMTLATVYNVLEFLEASGLLSRRLSSNNKMYYDVNTTTHCHLYDVDDNSFVDFNDAELVKLVAAHLSSKRIRGFELERFDLQIIGRKKKKSAKWKKTTGCE